MVFNDNQAGRSQVKTIVYLRTLARAISLQSHSNNMSTIAISYLFIAATICYCRYSLSVVQPRAQAS